MDSGLCGHLPLGSHLHHGVELCPLLPVLKIVQAVRVRDAPALTGLEAAVVLVHRTGEVIGDALKVELLVSTVRPGDPLTAGAKPPTFYGAAVDSCGEGRRRLISCIMWCGYYIGPLRVDSPPFPGREKGRQPGRR